MLGRVVRFESLVQTDEACHVCFEFMFNLTDEAWEDVKRGFKHNGTVVRETGVLLHVRTGPKVTPVVIRSRMFKPSPLRLP